MTPQEVLRRAMLESWGEVNHTRLARESGVSREQVSRFFNSGKGPTEQMAVRLGQPFGLEARDLMPPATQPVTLETIDARLQELQAELSHVEEARNEVAATLEGIVKLLERLLDNARVEDDREQASD